MAARGPLPLRAVSIEAPAPHPTRPGRRLTDIDTQEKTLPWQ